MTKNPLAVHIAQKMSEVRKLLAENKVHHIPVINGVKLVGIISTVDILDIGFSGGVDIRSLDA